MIVIPIPMPVITPIGTASFAGYSPEGPGVLDWKKAPPWAKYACINVIGGWEWWAKRPRWDWFIGVWGGDYMREPALVHVIDYSRRARKRSLHARPS